MRTVSTLIPAAPLLLLALPVLPVPVVLLRPALQLRRSSLVAQQLLVVQSLLVSLAAQPRLALQFHPESPWLQLHRSLQASLAGQPLLALLVVQSHRSLLWLQSLQSHLGVQLPQWRQAILVAQRAQLHPELQESLAAQPLQLLRPNLEVLWPLWLLSLLVVLVSPVVQHLLVLLWRLEVQNPLAAPLVLVVLGRLEVQRSPGVRESQLVLVNVVSHVPGRVHSTTRSPCGN